MGRLVRGRRKRPQNVDLVAEWERGKSVFTGDRWEGVLSGTTKRQIVPTKSSKSVKKRGYLLSPYLPEDTLRIVQIVEELEKNGIMVSRITKYDVQNKVILFEKQGKHWVACIGKPVRKTPEYQSNGC